MALSQNQEPPSPARLSLLVADAMRLWKEIPTGDIADAVDEGLIDAGKYPVNAGTVAKAWKDPKAKTLELGQSKTSGALALEHAREWEKNWNMMTEEDQDRDREQHREFFSGLRARLAAGSVA
jgi:hypothetical protein